MLTVNQRDLLALAITDRYVLPGASIDEWADKYEEILQMVEMTAIERCQDVQKEKE